MASFSRGNSTWKQATSATSLLLGQGIGKRYAIFSLPALTSLRGSKSRTIFLAFFALSSLLPILIALFVTVNYVFPFIGEEGVNELGITLYSGLAGMLLLPLASFFLMYRWLHRLENVTTEIMTKTTAVANKETTFAKERISEDGEYVKQNASYQRDESELQTLVRSFNSIFQTASDQLLERNHLRELLARLIAISSNLTAELDFDRLFPQVIAHVTEAMQAERTSMYVVDHQKKELWSQVSEGIAQIRLPLGQGISGRVGATGETLNIIDAWELPYFDRSYDLKHNFRTRSVLCIPIKNRRGEIIGVIQVINKKDRYCFDTDDEIFLKALTAQVSIALENSLLVDEILLSFNSSMSTLSAIVDAKHHFTAGHSERVKEYSLLIGEEMNLSKEDMETLKYAALLHDIGKIGVSDDVLTKDGAFTAEDWIEMKTHPAKTKSILDKFHFPHHLTQVPEIACRHHEKMDGTGYPDGLGGDNLLLGSRIIAVADVFDALTSLRDYPKYAFGKTLDCKPMPLTKVIDLLREQKGSQFDPEAVDAFLTVLPKALLLYRGEHFPPDYVDDTLQALSLTIS